MRRLVLFDIDGTLLSARGAPRRAFGRAMLEVYGEAGPIATHPFDGKTDPQIARELLRLGGRSDPDIDAGLAGLWATYIRELERELALPDHETDVYPGVRALLDGLAARARDTCVGLLTGNIEAGATLKLGSVGLAHHFHLGAYGSDCERRDGLPPIAVERALALTGVVFRGAEVVVVGDTPSDVTCGSALGVRAVAVATGRHDPVALRAAGAHVVFDDFGDTRAVLQALLD
jgi:phosphoglycolate phosphatase-like HAD superfamily hydrolase